MILWLFSLGGLIAVFFAAETIISDLEATILIGISIIGVAILLRHGKDVRD